MKSNFQLGLLALFVFLFSHVAFSDHPNSSVDSIYPSEAGCDFFVVTLGRNVVDAKGAHTFNVCSDAPSFVNKAEADTAMRIKYAKKVDCKDLMGFTKSIEKKYEKEKLKYNMTCNTISEKCPFHFTNTDSTGSVTGTNVLCVANPAPEGFQVLLDQLKGSELKTWEQLAEQSRQKALSEKREAEKKASAGRQIAPSEGPANVGEGLAKGAEESIIR